MEIGAGTSDVAQSGHNVGHMTPMGVVT